MNFAGSIWFWPRPRLPVVRHARSTDARALANLHRDGFERPWDEQSFDALLTDRSVSGTIAMGRFGKPIGFILTRQGADEAEILSIVVARKERRGGIGAALMDGHMAALVRARVRKLFLEVEAENRAAIALYSRFGFVEAGRRKSYYRKPDGTTADALIMAKEL